MIQPRAIIGLGNPGKRYAHTRHNIGFMVLDALTKPSGGGTWVFRGQSVTFRAEVGGREVLLVKPLTFMNLSGRAVRELMSDFELRVENLIVVLDDFNLPFGKIRIRHRGSAGGHHGLESVLEAVGTDEVARVRIGIGEQEAPSDKADFVLHDFPPNRAADLDELIEKAGSAVTIIVADGISKAMAVFNG